MRTLTRKLSTVGKATTLLRQTRPSMPDYSIPLAPNLTKGYVQKPVASSFTVHDIAAATGGGLACNEVNLSIPFNETNMDSYRALLDFLLKCYGINMVSLDIMTILFCTRSYDIS